VRTALLLSVYPVFHLLVRLAVSEGLEYDEAEQVVLAQSLALGYSAVAAQPPLYSWLQYLFFAVFGMNVFALATLRTILQILTQIALFRSGVMILGDRTLALLAALSLWMIPQYSVESMRMTHTVLATCLAALLLYALLCVWKSGGVASYLWLGTILGLGVLAKYNFMIYAGALVLAVLSMAPFRRRLLDPRMGLALAVAALLVAPHLLWLLDHLSQATTQIGTRMDMGTAEPWSLKRVRHSLYSFGKDPFVYLLLPVALHLAVFGRPRETFSEAAAALARLLQRFWLIAFGAMAVAVVIIAMARFREHWIQPFLVMLPLYLFLRRPSANPSPRRMAIFAAVLATVILLLMGWRFVELWEGHRFRAPSRLNTPYPELARQISAAGFRDGVIVADHNLLGGNLRFVLQDATVVTTRMAEAGAIVPPGPCLIVWDARRDRNIPDGLAAWVATGGQAAPPVRYAEARGRRADHALFRLGFIQVPACRRPAP
jgi:4-amino-4-deoxy-L-arabinose transferase-like glycosyltransferase